MKQVIRWAVVNPPAMNVMMLGVLVFGALSMYWLKREEFPNFELEIILVAVPYPGASPEEVEAGICQKIEEAVRSIEGIKKQTSIAKEGAGNVILELEADVQDVQKILNEVRSEIDRIPSFPDLAEDPEVKQITMRRPAIQVSVVGSGDDDPNWEWKLREVAEDVRDELLHLPSVTKADLVGARDYQIDVEISEATLRRYGLTLR
ncbi:MAG: efflux RND transporter permease subunit, partial [Planctomycetales bacterium]